MTSIGSTINSINSSQDAQSFQQSQQSQTSNPTEFQQVLTDAVGTTPNTLQVQFDTTPGPLYGRPIAPDGASEVGQWAVLPDGSYFSASDVSATGLATLHAPPAGWQNTPTGQTLTSPAGIVGGAGDTGNLSTLQPSASTSGGSGVVSSMGTTPNALQVQFDTTPGPLYGRPIAPDGASEVGQWAVLPDGSYFSASDVSATGLATLHAPPAGWQNTPTGQTLTSPSEIAGATIPGTIPYEPLIKPVVPFTLPTQVVADSAASSANPPGGSVQDLVTSLLAASERSFSQSSDQIQQALATLFTTGS